MIRWRPASLGGERLAQEVLDVEDLDAALAHPGDELVVLPLGALDPQDVVEQQLVVVGRGQPLEAEVRPVDDDLAQLADLGMDAECRHGWVLLQDRWSVAATTLVPPVPATRSSICSSEPMAARLPVAATNSAAADDLGPHRPGREVHRRELVGRDPVDAGLRRRAPVAVDAVDVGRHHEEVGAELTRQQAAGEVLVDDRLDTRRGWRSSPGTNIVGMPPPPAQMTTEPCSSSQRIGPDLEDPLRPRRRHDAPPVRRRPASRPSPSPRRARRPRPRRRPGRRTWSGRRRPGRRGRPRPS